MQHDAPRVTDYSTTTMDAGLPQYERSPMARSSNSSTSRGARPPTEHLYHLTSSKSRPWLTLKVTSKAPASSYLPAFYQGEAITGSVVLCLDREEPIKSVSVQVSRRCRPACHLYSRRYARRWTAFRANDLLRHGRPQFPPNISGPVAPVIDASHRLPEHFQFGEAFWGTRLAVLTHLTRIMSSQVAERAGSIIFPAGIVLRAHGQSSHSVPDRGDGTSKQIPGG